METPLVSVVIPFYSGKAWLFKAIESALNQTYKNVEILIINDGSKENFVDDMSKYGDNITIINKKNGGPASARNLGIEKASGKYIAFLDSDDLWLPDKLSMQISEMESKDYLWSQHSYEMFWDSGNRTKVINTKIYSGDVYRDCFTSLKIQTSCVVVLRKILIDNNIRFTIEKKYGEDGAFYKQIAKMYPLGYIDGVYSKFRIRGSNAGFRAQVQINDKASIWEEIKADKYILNFLPNTIILAYMISSLSSKFINCIHRKLLKNDKSIEAISKIMYVFPYMFFKINARRR